MALNSGLGFSRFAEREHHLLDVIATAEPPPRKLTLHELRAQRKAAKRALRDLQSLSADQIQFDTPAQTSTLTSDIQSLEEQMREALGLDQPVKHDKPEPELLLASFEFKTVPAKTAPPPGVEQASETAKRHAALERELRATLGVPTPPKPEAPTRKPTAPRTLIKRQLEVILQVRNADWWEIPFSHVEFNMTSVEAEICAGKAARALGLTVLKTISTTVREFEYTVGEATVRRALNE